jgi:peptide/nickel transport system substrate-binding protein
MRKTKLSCASLCVLFAVFLSIASCTKKDETATSAASGPQSGGTLRMITDRPTAFLGYPQKMSHGAHIRHAAPAIQHLFRHDQKGELIPWLATEYKLDAGAKTITLTLRKGVKFHDGTDFNAEAVKWNLEQAVKEKQFGSALIKSVDAVDPSTVRINLDAWNNTLMDMLATSYIGMMISPSAFQKNGAEWASSNPVGTGPFKFVSWDKDSKVTFAKFDGYWEKGKPYLDGIEIIEIADKVVGNLSFRKGEADVLVEPLAKDIAGLEKDGYAVVRNARALAAPVAMVMDSADPKSPFSNLKVRQAAQHALDNKALLNAIIFGEGKVATQWIYEGHPAYNPDIAGYPYNPTKAKQLLAEAGYAKGFKTKYTYPTGVEYNQLGAAIAGQLKEVGIEVELVPVTFPQWMTTIFQGGKWEGLVYDGPPPYPDVTAGLHERYSGDGKHLSMMIAPDDYKQAIEKAVTAPDLEGKKKYTKEALKLMTDKYALTLYTYWRGTAAIQTKKVHDSGLWIYDTVGQWRPEDTWLEKK